MVGGVGLSFGFVGRGMEEELGVKLKMKMDGGGE